MKKIFLSITAVVVALSIISIACNKPDKPTGTRLLLPKRARISLPEGDTNRWDQKQLMITLNATADGATGYRWEEKTGKGWSQISGREEALLSAGARLIVTKSLNKTYPDERMYRVAGTNKGGTGLYSETISIRFIPPERPTQKPEIRGNDFNDCDIDKKFVKLTASCDYATSYEWYYNDVLVTTTTGPVLLADSTGAYTVIAVNHLGRTSQKSVAKNVDWYDCVQELAGKWDVSAYNVITETDIIYRDSIAASGDDYWMTNFANEGERFFVIKVGDNYYIPSSDSLPAGTDTNGVPIYQTVSYLITDGPDAGNLYVLEGRINLTSPASDFRTLKVASVMYQDNRLENPILTWKKGTGEKVLKNPIFTRSKGSSAKKMKSEAMPCKGNVKALPDHLKAKLGY